MWGVNFKNNKGDNKQRDHKDWWKIKEVRGSTWKEYKSALKVESWFG